MNKAKSFSRVTDARRRFGIGRSTFWAWVLQGLMVPPVKFGSRISVWPDHELDLIAEARFRGESNCEIQKLVYELVSARYSVPK